MVGKFSPHFDTSYRASLYLTPLYECTFQADLTIWRKARENSFLFKQVTMIVVKMAEKLFARQKVARVVYLYKEIMVDATNYNAWGI